MEYDVNRFFYFFDEKLEHISRIDGDSKIIFRKVLYSSLIDALSKSVHPTLSNGDRFIRVIDRFSHWPNRDKLSLPHLQRMLTLVPDPSFEKLRKYVFNEIGAWPIHCGQVINIARDSDEKEIRNLWPNTKDEKKCLGNLTIDSFRHKNLLWAYRNCLVHELREPGYAMESEDDLAPYYISRTTASDDPENPQMSIELCYPLRFFDDISKKIKNNLKEYFVENKISPYLSFKYGTYWMDELNVIS